MAEADMVSERRLMTAFCDRQGKAPNTVRFLFDGERVNPTDTPDSVSYAGCCPIYDDLPP